MAETGYRFATSTTASTGTWTSTGNFFATDGVEGQCSIAAKSVTSVQILNNFGFTTSIIPPDATIDQVLLRAVWRVTTDASVIAVLGVAAHHSSAGLLSTHKNALEITALTTDTYDITADFAWTPSDLSDASLTVHMRPNNGNDASDPFYRIDSISLDAFYTPVVPAARRFYRATQNLDGIGSDGIFPGNDLE